MPPFLPPRCSHRSAQLWTGKTVALHMACKGTYKWNFSILKKVPESWEFLHQSIADTFLMKVFHKKISFFVFTISYIKTAKIFRRKKPPTLLLLATKTVRRNYMNILQVIDVSKNDSLKKWHVKWCLVSAIHPFKKEYFR